MTATVHKLPERKPDPYTVICDSTEDLKVWLEHRKTGIGASEIAGVLGISPYTSELKLYAEKVGAVEPDDLSDVEAVMWGQLLEPVIRDQFGRQTGREVKKAGLLLRSNQYPWALATLDGWCGENGKVWPFEIKNVTAYKAEEWAEGPPEHYRAQLQQQMLVTGEDRATIACLLGGNRLMWADEPRDEQMIRKIIFHGERFWERVQKGDPPPPDGSAASRAVLHKLFPVDDGSVVELPNVLRETVELWCDAKEREAAAKREKEGHENTIKATLGKAERGIFPGGDQVSWKTTHYKERTQPAYSARFLRFHPSKIKQ